MKLQMFIEWTLVGTIATSAMQKMPKHVVVKLLKLALLMLLKMTEACVGGVLPKK